MGICDDTYTKSVQQFNKRKRSFPDFGPSMPANFIGRGRPHIAGSSF